MSIGGGGRGQRRKTAGTFVDDVDDGVNENNVLSSLRSNPIFNIASQQMSVESFSCVVRINSDVVKKIFNGINSVVARSCHDRYVRFF